MNFPKGKNKKNIVQIYWESAKKGGDSALFSSKNDDLPKQKVWFELRGTRGSCWYSYTVSFYYKKQRLKWGPNLIVKQNKLFKTVLKQDLKGCFW